MLNDDEPLDEEAPPPPVPEPGLAPHEHQMVLSGVTVYGREKVSVWKCSVEGCTFQQTGGHALPLVVERFCEGGPWGGATCVFCNVSLPAGQPARKNVTIHKSTCLWRLALAAR